MCVFVVLLLSYLLTRSQELARTYLISALACTHLLLLQAHKVFWHKGSSQMDLWCLLWTLSYAPVHAEDVGECEVHASCAVCLESLCTSSASIAQSAVNICFNRGAAMSACRSWRRLAVAGLSVARSRGLSPCRGGGLYEASGGLPDSLQRLASLPCGHVFHLGCIDLVVKDLPSRPAHESSLQCPTCRGSFGSGWNEMHHEHRLSARLGTAALFILFGAVRLLPPALLER